MTDLDRKIAELKGWRLFKPGETTPEDHAEWSGSTAVWKPESLATWSTSDSKALELVDELIAVEAAKPHAPHWGPPSLGFSITRERGSGAYAAHLSVSDSKGENTDWHAGAGATRPEAICRAYVAAVTWMRERKA